MYYVVEIVRFQAPVTSGHHGARPASYFTDSVEEAIACGLAAWGQAVASGTRCMLVFDSRYAGPPKASITPAPTLGPEYVHVTRWDAAPFAAPSVTLWKAGTDAAPVVEGVPPPRQCPVSWWASWRTCGPRDSA